MKCQDCVEKNVHELDRHIGKAKLVLVDYDSVKLLCQECYHEYVHVFGEIDLDSFHLEMDDLEQAFKRISEILEYHTKKYNMLLKENSELKKKKAEE